MHIYVATSTVIGCKLNLGVIIHDIYVVIVNTMISYYKIFNTIIVLIIINSIKLVFDFIHSVSTIE